MKEIIHEVYSSIAEHKLRSLLTGFGVAWGMCILIVLLGAGNGFKSGILTIFSSYASNSIWVTGNRTSKTSTTGLQLGVEVKFSDHLLAKTQNVFPQIKLITEEISLFNAKQVNYKDNAGYFQIKGAGEGYKNIKQLDLAAGSWLNPLDYNEERRSVVIGSRVKDVLFKNENPIGKSICISGVYFQVKGILSEGTIFNIAEQNSVYLPSITLINIFNLNREYNTFGILLDNNLTTDNFEQQLKNFLIKEIGFDKEDKSALYINNIQLQVKAFNSLFSGINTFLWILGICFLLSGMISIANIMLVVVKERTKEIGIRKALGATPRSIIQLIMLESVIITVAFGLVGLIFGSIGLVSYNWIISAIQSSQETIFEKGYVEYGIILISFAILIISGIIAGVWPAKKAGEVMPIHTLNDLS